METRKYLTDKLPTGVHGPRSVIEHLRPDLWRLHRFRPWYLLHLFGAQPLGQIVHRGGYQWRFILCFLCLLPIDRMQLIRIAAKRCLQPTRLAVSVFIRRRIISWPSSGNYCRALRDGVRRLSVERASLFGLWCQGAAALRLGQHQTEFVPGWCDRAWTIQGIRTACLEKT